VLRQFTTNQIAQPACVIELTIGEQLSVGRDPTAVEFQLQAAVKIDPQGTIIRCTRRRFD